MKTSLHRTVHDPLTTIRNLETFIQDFLEIIEEMFHPYYKHSDLVLSHTLLSREMVQNLHIGVTSVHLIGVWCRSNMVKYYAILKYDVILND